jgi:hypothetical protein
MLKPSMWIIRVLLLAAVFLTPLTTRGDVVSKIYVGTLSNPLSSHGANPANNPGMFARGQKYVVRTTFDTDDIVMVDASTRFFQTRDFQSISLNDAPGGSNTFELFIPSLGFGSVLTQTGQDHFVIGGDTAQTAEIHFFNACTSAASCAIEFRGFEFESNFIRNNSPTTPDPSGDIIFELRDPDATFSDATVTSHVVNILDGNDPGLGGIMFNGGHVDVRSESASASGGQLAPGVFFGEAVAVVAEAGASPLVYSATTLSQSTHAGTEQVTDPVAPILPGSLRSAPSAIDQQPRQADNDLGAGRGDQEDFLNFAWTVNGANVPGSENGTRLNRVVETLDVANPMTQQHGSRVVNDGTRTVENVNITRSLAQSGLTTTIDTTTFDLLVIESITGLTDTDSVAVSYSNTVPSIVNASHTVLGVDIRFDVTVTDDDLAANGTIPGFEALFDTILVDTVDQTAFFSAVIGDGSGGTQFVSQADLISQFGAGTHNFELRVADRAQDLANMFASQSFVFDVVPEPGSAALLVGLFIGTSFFRWRPRIPTAKG